MSDLSSNKRYVLALSGGVDSVVLLDALVHNRLFELTDFQSLTPNIQLVVAHFDHGIRDNSASDEEFTRGVAGEYGLPYETERVELGHDASEEQARTLRYNFLRRCCKNNNSQLITAHHQDDVLETMIINLLRGTSWRGLTSLSSDSNILRPLLNVPKSAILEYAKRYNLKWREDSTNTNQDYLRNYVRLTVLPQIYQKNPHAKSQLLQINQKLSVVKKEIATELQNLITKYQLSISNYQLPRYDLIMYSPDVAKEVIYYILTRLDPSWHPSSQQIIRALHFIKTGQSGKQMEISKHLNISLTKVLAQFKNV